MLSIFKRKSKPVPAEIHDEVVRGLQRRIRAQHAALFLLVKSQGGSVVIPAYYVKECKHLIGTVRYSDTTLGGMQIEVIDAREPDQVLQPCASARP